MMNKVSILGLALMAMAVHTVQGQYRPEKVVDKSLITQKMHQLSKEALSPQALWELGRVSAEGLTADGQSLIYGVSKYNLAQNTSEKNLFVMPIAGGASRALTEEIGAETVLQVLDDGTVWYMYKGQIWAKHADGGVAVQLTAVEGGLSNVKISPDRKHILFSKAVLIHKNHSVDKYADLDKSNVYIYDDLDYRHWDSFNEGRFNHPFVASFDEGKLGEPIDILGEEPYYSPQAPFGGAEDYTWSPDGQSVIYVCKKKYGKEYAQSTNTDLYRYNIRSGKTENLTPGMKGYDTQPKYSKDGQKLSWLSMATDGSEADKNDLVVYDAKNQQQLNLTAHWDGTVNSYFWSADNKTIFFTAPTKGTVQLFKVEVPTSSKTRSFPKIEQLSEGQFDISAIVGEAKGGLVVSSTRMTRAAEVYFYDLKKRALKPITTVNDEAYSAIAENKVEGRYTKASDGKDLFSWVVYPPNFDPAKKYPTLLYCQGGPQSATTQTYSIRWNLQLIASQGYIVIAPNRRGMPGWGVAWNAEISKDWGGQAIQDYLSAIDDLSKESYVDTERVGAIGASYGGYSVFQLAGIHQGRFKSFISHCGLFNMTSWYGTTEELFFANHDLGGPYWEDAHQKTYTDFNPITKINQWNTPILIFQGGKDYRVPVGQGLEAFQGAQLKGIKSRLVYLPDENHWVLNGQNAQVWQREFFSWLKETL